MWVYTTYQLKLTIKIKSIRKIKKIKPQMLKKIPFSITLYHCIILGWIKSCTENVTKKKTYRMSRTQNKICKLRAEEECRIIDQNPKQYTNKTQTKPQTLRR